VDGPYEGKALTRSTATAAADRFIGMHIRECRIMRGLTQGQLSELIGVNQRQVHKYEHGINSVSASRLFVIARELGAPLESFFEGLDRKEWQLPRRQRLLLAVVRDTGEIQNEKYLEVIKQLTRALAEPVRLGAKGVQPRSADAVPRNGKRIRSAAD
jgi:transcriptional regulator with XRE-family HTH domain